MKNFRNLFKKRLTDKHRKYTYINLFNFFILFTYYLVSVVFNDNKTQWRTSMIDGPGQKKIAPAN